MHVHGILFFNNRRKIPDEKFRNIFLNFGHLEFENSLFGKIKTMGKFYPRA